MTKLGLLGSSAIGSAAFLGFTLVAATPAYAQADQPPQTPPPPAQTTTQLPQAGAPGEGDIVVTGSRIKRPNFDTLEPSIVIDAQQIENRGFETLGQAINEQPSFGVPGSSPVGLQTGAFGSGQSFVNFLGLGSQRTLVLVDGQRVVSGNTSSIFGPTSAGLQVDLNTINPALVSRIETIAIGGAPIYGSDAIAGTINVVLKHDFQGLQIDAQSGVSGMGDAPDYFVRGLWGHNFGSRGNITVAAEWDHGDGLLAEQRSGFLQNRFYDPCLPGSQFTECLFTNRRLPNISETGLPSVADFVPIGSSGQFGVPGFVQVGVMNAQGQQLKFDRNGNFIPIDFGQLISGIDASGGNGFDLNSTQQLLTDTRRFETNILFDYHLTDSIRFSANAWYAYSSATNLRDQPEYNTALFASANQPAGNIILSVNNPFLTPAERSTILSSIANNPFSDQNCPFFDPAHPETINSGTFGGTPCPAVQNYFYLGRANTDITTGRATSTTRLYRLTSGLDGSFHLGSHAFTWQVTGNYGRSDTAGQVPTIILQNYANAVGMVTAANPNGIPCLAGLQSAAVPTLSATCAPLDIFGNGVATQAARDYVTAIANPRSRNEEWVVNASVTGQLLRLPGGDLSVALGVEHRNESTNFRPGQVLAGPGGNQSYTQNVAIGPVVGKYHTNEAFGELTADLISPRNHVPLVYSLTLHGAARYVDHSTAGGDWTYTTDGRWAPIRDIAFRANYTRAIRAPAITELFNPSSTFFNFALDPCDPTNINSGPNPATRQKNCASQGIGPGSGFVNQNGQQNSFLQGVAGNPKLTNERSNAYSFGTVISPRFLPNFRLSLDYVHIQLNNAISQFNATQVLDACYDAANFPNNQFCADVTRDLSGTPATNHNFGQPTFVVTSFFNASQLKYRGILGALDYTVRTPFLGANSRIGVNATYQHLQELSEIVTAGAAKTILQGIIGYPHDSAEGTFSYENGPYLLYTTINYTGSVNQESQVPVNFRQFERLKAVTYVTIGTVITVNKRMRFRLIVDNLFNTGAPFPVPDVGPPNGVVSYFPGLLGRYYRAGVQVTF